MAACKKKIEVRLHYVAQWGESLMIVTAFERFPMSWTEGDIWTVRVEKSSLKSYFFAVVRDGLIVRMDWDSHSLPAGDGPVNEKWLDSPCGSPFPRRHSRSDFDKPGYRGAGVAVPVFSLRSENGFGIGEFNDLKLLADWASAAGLGIIQLLPVNDTTRKGEWKDSYPYNPVSSFALNPMYVNLNDLGVKESAAFRKDRDRLNASDSIDYPEVFRLKTKYIIQAWKQNGRNDTGSKAYTAFVKDNAFWLGEYCSFCAERDGLAPEFYSWLQYHLDRQFSAAVKHARCKGVSFKGDLPIGVSADSAEAHFHPELFNLDSTAGAPPDFFSEHGQNWGFPTYNWESMAKNHFLWWKARLRQMNRYFDAFRIDHILGFFRIWEIPLCEESGKMGHFNPAIPYSKEEINAAGLPLDGLFLPDPRHQGYFQPRITPDDSALDSGQHERFGAIYNDFFFHRHDEFWRRNAELKLPELLSSNGMLACGEDLGMVPDCVAGVMDHWKILSLEMTCMEKGRPWPYFSVCSTSSHDMSPLRMGGEGGDMSSSQVEDIIRNHLNSVSMLAIFPIQDLLAMDDGLRNPDPDERINEPANPNHHWKFRLHITLEQLCSERGADLISRIRRDVCSSGRLN